MTCAGAQLGDVSTGVHRWGHDFSSHGIIIMSTVMQVSWLRYNI